MLNELLERYWNAAHAEGKEGRDHDTEDGIAQRTLTEIHAEVQRMVMAERINAMAAILDGCPKDGSDTEIVLRRAWDRVRLMRSNLKVTGAPPEGD